MGSHLESRDQRPATLQHRELLKEKFSGLLKIADGLSHGLSLRRGAGFGVEGHETAFVCGRQNGGEVHHLMMVQGKGTVKATRTKGFVKNSKV
jgi:hypothetical protein